MTAYQDISLNIRLAHVWRYDSQKIFGASVEDRPQPKNAMQCDCGSAGYSLAVQGRKQRLAVALRVPETGAVLDKSRQMQHTRLSDNLTPTKGSLVAGKKRRGSYMTNSVRSDGNPWTKAGAMQCNNCIPR
jgi:hypothetical protein